jgi:hypothetical protein
MARRGRKRRLDIESEYWLLLASVGTVEAGRPVGIVRKSGSCATGCSSLRRSAGSAVRGFPASRFVREIGRAREFGESVLRPGTAVARALLSSSRVERSLTEDACSGVTSRPFPGAPLYRSEWSWGTCGARRRGGRWRPVGNFDVARSGCGGFGWAFGSDSTTADPLRGVVVQPGLLDLAQIDQPLGECREQSRQAAPVH